MLFVICPVVQYTTKCRLCCDRNKIINHIISEYSKLAQRELRLDTTNTVNLKICLIFVNKKAQNVFVSVQIFNEMSQRILEYFGFIPCRGVKRPKNSVVLAPDYVPPVLELWGVWSTSSFLLLQGPL